jgi:hypothetical protein
MRVALFSSAVCRGCRAQAGNWDVSRPAGEKGGGRKLTGVVGIGAGKAEPEEVAEGESFVKGVSARVQVAEGFGKGPLLLVTILLSVRDPPSLWRIMQIYLRRLKVACLTTHIANESSASHLFQLPRFIFQPRATDPRAALV